MVKTVVVIMVVMTVMAVVAVVAMFMIVMMLCHNFAVLKYLISICKITNFPSNGGLTRVGESKCVSDKENTTSNKHQIIRLCYFPCIH